MINWISVKEKLPDEWVDVLAFHENGAVSIQHMFTNNLIEFRGYVEVEQGYNDCAYNTYIVKSFEALNYE